MDRKKCILIAEDEQDMLQSMLKVTLSKRGNLYDTIVCTDGYEVLAYLRDRDIDVVVLDLNMFNLDGLSVCKIMAKDNRLKDIPIIVSSGHIDESMEEQLKTLGVTHILKKPYPMKDLLDKVDDIVLNNSVPGTE